MRRSCRLRAGRIRSRPRRFSGRRVRGQITILICLILPVYLTLMLILLGGAQAACVRDCWSYSVLSATENVKASYCRELFDEFRLFAVYEESADAAEITQKTLEIGANPPYLFDSLLTNFLMIHFNDPQVSVTEKTGLIDPEGKELRRAIVEAEHDVAIPDLVGELGEFATAFALGKDSEQEVHTQSEIEQIAQEAAPGSGDSGNSAEAGEDDEVDSAEAAEQNRVRKVFLDLYESIVHVSPVNLMLTPSDHVSTAAYPNERAGIETTWHFEELIPHLPENVLAAADGLLIDDYCRKYAKSFADCGEEDHYELEYILSGRGNDREALSGAMTGFLTIRTITNLGSLLAASPAHQAAIETLCSPLIAFPLVYPLTVILADTAMAYCEAVLDGRRLLHGKKVKIIKQDIDWKFDVVHCGEMILNPEYVPESDVGGLSYETYLFFQLLFVREKTKLARMGDVIQWRLMKYDDSFRLAKCNTGYDLEMQADYPQGLYPFDLPSPGLTASRHVGFDD